MSRSSMPSHRTPTWYAAQKVARQNIVAALAGQGVGVGELVEAYHSRRAKMLPEIDAVVVEARTQLADAVVVNSGLEGRKLTRDEALVVVDRDHKKDIERVRISVEADKGVDILKNALRALGVKPREAERLAQAWRPFAFGGVE